MKFAVSGVLIVVCWLLSDGGLFFVVRCCLWLFVVRCVIVRCVMSVVCCSLCAGSCPMVVCNLSFVAACCCLMCVVVFVVV